MDMNGITCNASHGTELGKVPSASTDSIVASHNNVGLSRDWPTKKTKKNAWSSLLKMGNTPSVKKENLVVDETLCSSPRRGVEKEKNGGSMNTTTSMIYVPSALLTTTPTRGSGSMCGLAAVPHAVLPDPLSSCGSLSTARLSPLSPHPDVPTGSKQRVEESSSEESRASPLQNGRTIPNRPGNDDDQNKGDCFRTLGMRNRAEYPDAKNRGPDLLKNVAKEQAAFVETLRSVTVAEEEQSTTVEIPDNEVEWDITTETVPYGESEFDSSMIPLTVTRGPSAPSQRGGAWATGGGGLESREARKWMDENPVGFSDGELSPTSWSSAFSRSTSAKPSSSPSSGRQSLGKSNVTKDAGFILFSAQASASREANLTSPHDDLSSCDSSSEEPRSPSRSPAKRARSGQQHFNMYIGENEDSSKKCCNETRNTTPSRSRGNDNVSDDGYRSGNGEGDVEFIDFSDMQEPAFPLSDISDGGGSSTDERNNELSCFGELLLQDDRDMAEEISDGRTLKRYRALRTRESFDHASCTEFDEEEFAGSFNNMEISICSPRARHRLYDTNCRFGSGCELSRCNRSMHKQSLVGEGSMPTHFGNLTKFGVAGTCGEERTEYGEEGLDGDGSMGESMLDGVVEVWATSHCAGRRSPRVRR